MKALTQGIIPERTYKTMRNAPAINVLQTLAKKDMKIMTDINGDSEGIIHTTAKEEDIEIKIGHFPLVKVNPQSRKLLDILLMKISEIAPYGKEATPEAIARVFGITIRLDEFMSLFGLKHKDNAREQFRQTAQTLMNIYVKIDYTIDRKKGKRTVKEHKHVDSYMFEATIETRNLTEDTIRNSRTEFRFNITVLEYLCNRFIMPANVKMFAVKSKDNPHSYNLIRRLTEYYNMNATATNEPVRISVRRLLEHCPEIPTPEEVKGQHYSQLIREPFERDMNALEFDYGLIHWEYSHSKGSLISQEELDNGAFEDWQNWYITYYLPDYPVEKEKEVQKRKKEASTPKK